MDSRQSRHVVRSMLFWVAVALSGAVGAQEVTRKADSDKQPTESGQDDPSTQSAVQLDTVQVTGTRIKGGTTPSPVITIDSTRIREEGFTDLGEVIRSLPQNFGGGQNPGVFASANIGGNNFNTTGGSSLNLRGLGQDASLTLLNGRRLAYGGASQGVDISAIPVEAVERIEIVPDGASALYGSDAVGGVANVILKQDFEGAVIGARSGHATEGGLGTRAYTATAGERWPTGGLTATLKRESIDPIQASQRDFAQAMYQPATLWSGSDLRSGLISGHQSIGEALTFQIDALRTERQAYTDTGYAKAYYHNTPETHSTLVSPALVLALASDWTLTASASLGRDKTYTHQQVIQINTGLVSTNSLGTYSNSSITYELGAEGPVMDLPAGEVRMAAGAGYRDVEFLSLGISSNRTLADGSEKSRFAYTELNMPLVAPTQNIRGLRRLALTGALRTEDYDRDGRVTTPKLGLIYSPEADFTLRTSWGKSFKTPRLLQLYGTQSVALYPAATFGAAGVPRTATVFYRSGSNPDLSPERARTWSATLAFHPEALPALEAELSWFDIDYTGRIVQPVVYSEALANSIYAPFVTRDPSQAQMAQAIADSASFLNYAGAPYDPRKVIAIVDNRSVNAARQRIHGADLSGGYRFDLEFGELTIRGSTGWMESTQATLPGQRPSDLAGTLFYPARLNGRAGLVWNSGVLTTSLFGNYRSGVRNRLDGKEGASFTTFDATIGYEVHGWRGLLSGLTVELTAQNLLDREPPRYAAVARSEAPYDSTNYSAVGRFLALALSKRW